MGIGKYMILAFLCFFLFKFGRSDEPTDEFTGDLLKTLYDKTDKEANTVFSPVSLYVLLALLEQGSGGATLQELTTVLHADADTSSRNYRNLVRQLRSVHNGTTLEIANKVYVENNFQIASNFRSTAVNDFDAGIDNIEFRSPASAANTINQWVSDNTHGRITKLVDADGISPDTVVMLLNAVYFNGKWSHSFNANETVDSPFTTMSGTKSTVPMMHLHDKLVAGELADVDAKYVRLPFQDKDFSMIVVVPNQVDGLQAVVNKLQADHLASILEGSYVRTVDLKMPKFKFSTTSKLVSTLETMGLHQMFTTAADLSGIANAPLEVSDVVQIAEIEVDEKGATASAVTGILGLFPLAAKRPLEKILIINADHPFVFFITYGKNSIPLFGGWVARP